MKAAVYITCSNINIRTANSFKFNILIIFSFNVHQIILCLPFTGNKTGRTLAIILPIIAAVLATVVLCSCMWRRKRKTPGKPSLPGEPLM